MTRKRDPDACTYEVVTASFSQIIEMDERYPSGFEQAVYHLLNKEANKGVRVRFWHATSGKYIDVKVFMYSEQLRATYQEPNEAADGKTRKRNGENKSDEKHVRRHIPGLNFDSQEEAQAVDAMCVFSQEEAFSL